MGYLLTFVAVKLGLGILLNGIKNSVMKVMLVCSKLSLDYMVIKIPHWKPYEVQLCVAPAQQQYEEHW